MKRIIRAVLSGAMLSGLLAMLGGCSSVVKLNVMHAPEINPGAARTLVVKPFAVSGQADLDVANGKDFWGNMVKNAVVSNLTAPSDDSVRNRQHEELVQALARNGYYQVSNGAADATLTGHVAYKVSDSLSDYEYKDNSGKKKKTYTLKRMTTVTVDFQMTDNKGLVLGASRVEQSGDHSWNGDSQNDVRRSALEKSVTDCVNEVMATTPDLVVQKVAPHYVMEERTLEKSDSDLIKSGNKAAEGGDWATAARNWQAMQDSGNSADRAAALFNLAVYDEMMGRLDDAQAKLQSGLAITHNDKFTSEANRIRARMQEEQMMRQNEAKRSQAAR